MITVERVVTTDRPPERVFAYLSDFTTAVEWDAGTVECSLISGDGGPGTRYRNVSRFLGRTTALVYEVRERVPDTRYVIEGANATVTSLDTITLRPVAAGTEVTYRADFTFKGFARWLEPVLRLPTRRLADDAERSLATALHTL